MPGGAVPGRSVKLALSTSKRQRDAHKSHCALVSARAPLARQEESRRCQKSSTRYSHLTGLPGQGLISRSAPLSEICVRCHSALRHDKTRLQSVQGPSARSDAHSHFRLMAVALHMSNPRLRHSCSGVCVPQASLIQKGGAPRIQSINGYIYHSV